MEFTHYTGEPVRLALELVNTYGSTSSTDGLTAVQHLQALADRFQLDRKVTPQDLEVTRRVRTSLRSVFAATELNTAMGLLNDLLTEFTTAPRLVDDPSDQGLHIHFEPSKLAVGPWLGAITAVGMAFMLADEGLDRLGLCASTSCQRGFLDISKNRQKRFCSERCAHRESVAAYRDRLRTACDQEMPPHKQGMQRNT